MSQGIFTKGQPIKRKKFVLIFLLVSLSSVFLFQSISFELCRVNSFIFIECGFDGELVLSRLNYKSAMTVRLSFTASASLL